MASRLELLPTEILRDISEILDITHPPSLLGFACANKCCYFAASTVLFRTAKITVTDGPQEGHFQDVHDLEKRLLRDDAFAHVRRLIFHVYEFPARFPYLSLDMYDKGHNDDGVLGSCWKNCADHWQSSSPSLAEDQWEPVIRLVGQLPGLVDLFWACPEQIPLPLLQTLHKKTKLCRLHHYTFKLDIPTENSRSSYESALTTSPCLYSIGNMDDTSDKMGFKSARILQSPNLKRVYLWLNNDKTERDDIDRHLCRPVPLEVLQVDGVEPSPPLPFSIVRREAFGDLSALRILKLKRPLALQGLPVPSDFPSLVTLVFSCIWDKNVPPQYWDETANLLRNLPHLITLQIRDWDRAVPITPCLSPNLRTLILNTSRWSFSGVARLRDDYIHQLADICPNLEYLRIELRRSRGDAAEVARYRSLGRLPRLQELDLYLDVSPPEYILNVKPFLDTAIEPWFDKQDAKYLRGYFRPHREGHVRDVLLNSAIDEALARSIFEVIDSNKQRLPGSASSLPLERLSLHVEGGTAFPLGINPASYLRPLESLLIALERRWVIERDVRDDAREVLHASGVSWRDKRFLEEDQFDHVEENQYWFGLWRRVWPVEGEGVDWWDDWKSRPLALEADASSNTG